MLLSWLWLLMMKVWVVDKASSSEAIPFCIEQSEPLHLKHFPPFPSFNSPLETSTPWLGWMTRTSTWGDSLGSSFATLRSCPSSNKNFTSSLEGISKLETDNPDSICTTWQLPRNITPGPSLLHPVLSQGWSPGPWSSLKSCPWTTLTQLCQKQARPDHPYSGCFSPLPTLDHLIILDSRIASDLTPSALQASPLTDVSVFPAHQLHLHLSLLHLHHPHLHIILKQVFLPPHSHDFPLCQILPTAPNIILMEVANMKNLKLQARELMNLAVSVWNWKWWKYWAK